MNIIKVVAGILSVLFMCYIWIAVIGVLLRVCPLLALGVIAATVVLVYMAKDNSEYRKDREKLGIHDDD